MLDFLLLILADILLAGNFAVTKGYQKREGVSVEKGLKFNMILGLFSALFMALLQGFRLRFTLFSVVMAFGFGLLFVLYNLIGFRIMEHGTMALYTVFLMTGGMVIPYIWGLVFLEEPFSLRRTLGLVIIAAAVFVMHSASGQFDIRQLLLCCAVFVLNGFVSVISKEHQIGTNAVSTANFICLYCLARLLICMVAYLLIQKIKHCRKTRDTVKSSYSHSGCSISGISLFFIGMSAIFSGLSSILQLNSAKNLPATVLYPIVTGGSIIFIAITGRMLYKEKLTKKALVGIGLCFLGTCMFL